MTRPLHDPDLRLEPDADEMIRLVDEAMKRIVAHHESLPRQPSASPEGAVEFARTLDEGLPGEGEDLEVLLDRVFGEYVPRSFNTASPGYLAYIPGGGLFHTAVANLISSSVNRYVGVAAAAPALVRLEMNVIRWFCEIVGYPKGAGGILTTGGSMANFIATVAARKDRLPDDFLSGVIYVSDQVHHSVEKAASLAGFPSANVRKIGSDDRFRLRVDLLEESIQRDRNQGFEPFMVVGSAGTTNTGAVDDLDAIAAVASREKLWFHIDGAYGGFFAMTESGRQVLSGLEKADSLSLDPHKALFLPYGSGSLLVRDPSALRRAHSVRADYMPPYQEDGSLDDFCEMSPELSRAFRGLGVWLPIKLFGIEPFRNNLEEKIQLARYATEELRKVDGIEIVAEPQLSIVAFRYRIDGVAGDEANRINRVLMESINSKKRIWLTGTMVGSDFVIRICVLSFRTHLERIEMALEDVRSSVERITRDRQGKLA